MASHLLNLGLGDEDLNLTTFGSILLDAFMALGLALSARVSKAER